jgi:raffinose/stachyose/melibiose transport system substrate-binding protein
MQQHEGNTVKGTRLQSKALAGAVTALALVALTACGSSNSSEDAAAATAAASGSASEAASAEPAGEPQTLTILVHTNAPSDEAFKALSAEFEAANPGVTVEFTSVPTNEFPKVRNSRIAAGAVDITEGPIAGGSTPPPAYVQGAVASDWIKSLQAGNWVDLSDQPWLANWSPGVMDALKWEGKDYAVPTGITMFTGVFYNKTMFADNGISVPTTWEEFVAAAETLQAANITPLIIGGKDQWPAALIMEGLVQSVIPDMAGFDEGLWTGTRKFTDPDSIEVLQKQQQTYSFANPKFPGVGYDTIPGSFAKGESAMVVDGIWSAPAITSAAPDLDFGYFPLPGSSDPANNQTLGGKLEFSMSIPANAPNVDLAKKWLAFYSDPANYQKFISAVGFFPAQPDIQTTAFLDGIQQYMGEDGFTSAWDQTFHPNPKAPAPLALGFPFMEIAPMGKSTDMNELAAKTQEQWAASLPQ